MSVLYTTVSFRFALEPLLPKKMHSRSQDKLDKDDAEKEKKDKKKEKRNSKPQEIFDKELRAADSPLPQPEAVILSETVISQHHRRPAPWKLLGPTFAPRAANGAVGGGHGLCHEVVTGQSGVSLSPPLT